MCTISQVSAGRRNRLAWEIDGDTSALAWASDDPDHLWIGHRGRPNEIVEKDPALLTPEGAAATAFPGGHVEGYPDTFRALLTAVYADIAAGAAGRRSPRTRRSPTATTSWPCATPSPPRRSSAAWAKVDRR